MTDVIELPVGGVIVIVPQHEQPNVRSVRDEHGVIHLFYRGVDMYEIAAACPLPPGVKPTLDNLQEIGERWDAYVDAKERNRDRTH